MAPVFGVISVVLIALDHMMELLLLAAVLGIAAFACLHGLERK